MKDKAEALGIKVDGRWSDSRIQEEIDKVSSSVEGADVVEEAKPVHDTDWFKARAIAIFEGQSPSLDIVSRVGRIRASLKDMGFTDFDKIELPSDEDYRRYF